MGSFPTSLSLRQSPISHSRRAFIKPHIRIFSWLGAEVPVILPSKSYQNIRTTKQDGENDRRRIPCSLRETISFATRHLLHPALGKRVLCLSCQRIFPLFLV
ncbi:hypothetical protein TNIN_462831 [Trichonephila inaurata madagascariensis]|uniref:Uncharacterized protein n=1 Tax=Trichonephila inaurata madagascariensis TaxID=2747483 RepID=A0A8X6XRT3_9ARAC|nr:hypothetical protein TNIN_462831 [Trichonephila inaurata madagascariensis]